MNSEKTKKISAEIMRVKGGANAIATMTFDDGHPRTSAKLNELLPKYKSRASLMLYCRKSLSTDEQISLWRDILAKGYLSCENHSMTHDYLTSNPKYTDPANLCEEKYIFETKESLEKIRGAFPTQDVLSFTIPYANYVPDARRHVMKTHYAALAGECVLVQPENYGKMQSLDPKVGNVETGETPEGTWHNVYYARLQPIYSVPREEGKAAIYPQLTMDNIIAYLDRCVRDGGWFITSCHGLYQGENQDLTEEQMEMLLQAMYKYVKENKLWVATFSEATKYIRERQNSSVTVTEADGAYLLTLSMNDKTPEGLPLDLRVPMPDGRERAVFDMPLTVRLNADFECEKVKYTQGGRVYYSDVQRDENTKYAYLDIVPSGTEVRIEQA